MKKTTSLSFFLQGAFWLTLVPCLVFWARSVGVGVNQDEWYLLVAFSAAAAFGILFSFLALHKRFGFRVYVGLVYLALLIGVFSFVETLFPGAAAFVALMLASLVLLFSPRVFAQNLILALALAGVALSFIPTVPFRYALLASVGLAFYDIVSVEITHNMVRLAKEVVSVHLPVVFVLPIRWRENVEHVAKFVPGSNAVFLGGGDAAIPAILVAVAPTLGLAKAVMIGTALGFAVLVFSFVKDPEHKPLPALPFIVSGIVASLTLAILFP